MPGSASSSAYPGQHPRDAVLRGVLTGSLRVPGGDRFDLGLAVVPRRFDDRVWRDPCRPGREGRSAAWPIPSQVRFRPLSGLNVSGWRVTLLIGWPNLLLAGSKFRGGGLDADPSPRQCGEKEHPRPPRRVGPNRRGRTRRPAGPTGQRRSGHGRPTVRSVAHVSGHAPPAGDAHERGHEPVVAVTVHRRGETQHRRWDADAPQGAA